MAVWHGLLLGFAYVLPSIDALVLRSRHLRRIVVINLVTGWTIIGWIVALVLAYRWRRRNVPFLPYIPPS